MHDRCFVDAASSVAESYSIKDFARRCAISLSANATGGRIAIQRPLTIQANTVPLLSCPCRKGASSAVQEVLCADEK